MAKQPDMSTVERMAQIDKFIPEAERVADERLRDHMAAGGEAFEQRPGYRGSVYTHNFWLEFFYRAMNELTIKAGLRV